MIEQEFGGSGITKELFSWIVDNFEKGKTIVELGAGDVSTKFLSEQYNLFSVEDNPKFCGRWLSKYIYAPLVAGGWYDTNILRENLPKHFDLLLIDGPTREGTYRTIMGDRKGILKHLDLFDLSATIIVDDTNRKDDRELLDNLESMTGKTKTIFSTFGILQ